MGRNTQAYVQRVPHRLAGIRAASLTQARRHACIGQCLSEHAGRSAGISAAGFAQARRRTYSRLCQGTQAKVQRGLCRSTQAKAQRAPHRLARISEAGSHRLAGISAAGYARAWKHKRSMLRRGSQATVQRASHRLAGISTAGYVSACRHKCSLTFVGAHRHKRNVFRTG